MTVSTHLDSLRAKHQSLSRRIEEAQKHPATDALTIAALKRQKLVVKEEIVKLSDTSH